MFDFHEKRKIRKILFSRPVIILLFAAGIFLSFSVYERYTVSVEMQKKLDERRAELEKLEMRAEVLNAKVEYLEDERGIEEELRSRFDVAREGEEVVILLDANNASATLMEEGVSSEEVQAETFWQKLRFWE